MHDIQSLENDADIRIKFASVNSRGGYDGDSHHEYRNMFPEHEGELVAGWRYARTAGHVLTRFEYERDAWRLDHPDLDIRGGAVEHETGVEILVASFLAPLAVEATVALVKWMWRKWSTSRSPGTVSPSLVVEVVTERSEHGAIRTTQSWTVRGPIEAEEAAKLLTRLVAQSSKGPNPQL